MDERAPARSGRSLPPWAFVVLAIALIAGLAAIWRFSEVGELVDPHALHRSLRRLGDTAWAIPVVWTGFVVGVLVLVPINAMFVAVGLTFGLEKALLLSTSGALLASLAVDTIGRRFDAERLLRHAPDWIDRWRRRGISEASVGQLSVMRLLPLGPFATINLIWAAARVPRRRVLAATLVGLTPGIVATSLLGEGLGLALDDLGAKSLAVAAAGAVALIALTWMSRRVARKFSSEPVDPPSERD